MIQRHLRPNKLKIILYCLTLTLIWFLYTKGDILKIRYCTDIEIVQRLTIFGFQDCKMTGFPRPVSVQPATEPTYASL